MTDYVRDEVAAGMVDRLLDIKRKYKEVVDLGSGAGHLVKELGSDTGTEKVLMTDGCGGSLSSSSRLDNELTSSSTKKAC